MPLQLVTAPAVEPLTLSEVMAHLRLDSGNLEPVPEAPTAALAAAGAGNVDDGAHRYLVTFVTAAGQTSAGTASSAVTVVDKTTNGKVSLSAIPVGGAAVTARRVYRTLAGGSTYFLLTTLADNTTTTYTDNTADASLGVGAPSTNTTGDPELVRLIATVRLRAELEIQRKLITQTWKLYLDGFPGSGRLCPSAWRWDEVFGAYMPTRYTPGGDLIVLPWPPVQSITHVKYYDVANVQRTLVDGTDYETDILSEPARIAPAYSKVWPECYPRANAVEVQFVVGYGAASAVPEDVKSWMLLMITHWYENRSAAAGKVEELPYIGGHLDPYRLVQF